jgi:peptide/nickel transport system substrate-binding protein
MLVSTLSSAAGVRTAAAQGNSRTINNHVVSGRFLEVWNAQGSEQNNVYVNGLPITDARSEIATENGKAYSTQWFERARYEAHPENKAPYDVLLGRLGATLSEGRPSIDPATGKPRNAADQPFVGIDKPADANGTTKVWFPETKHSVSGKILEYWNKYGGLQQFGFPLSEQFQEISATDGKTYTVQYFERNRFELHPEKQAPYEVELGLLGVQQYKAQPIAADKLPIAPPASTTSKKDTAIVAFGQEPNSLYGIGESALVVSRVLDAITFQDQLVARDEVENWFPLAAWYVPTLENGGSFYVGTGDDRHLVTKIKLRQGVKWADGSELTSNDVVYSYRLIMNPNSPVVTRTTQEKIASIDNPDKYTVVYNWMSPAQAKAKWNDPKTDKTEYAFLEVFVNKNKPVVDPLYFAIGTVHPQKYIEATFGKDLDVAAEAIVDSAEKYSRNPMGYGPYKVEKWTSGQELDLVQNTNYNLTAKPLLNKVVLRFISDVNQITAQLATGDVDVATSESFVVPPDNMDQLKSSGVVLANVPAASWEHIDYNHDFGPFKDRAVREAIITGINRQRIVDVVYKGGAAVMNGVVPPSVWNSLENPNIAKDYGITDKLPIYAYDANKAKSLLDAAGWVVGSDGIRAKGGTKLSFEYATTINAIRQRIQQLVQADLKAIGVDAKVKSYAASEYFGAGGIINRGVCQFCEFAWVGSSASDFSVWDSSQIPTEANPSLQNNQRYRNDKVDEANQNFGAEIERKTQAQYAATAQMEIMKDVALVPLVQRANIELYRNNLVNHKESNSQATSFWNLVQWYFK